MRKAAQKEKRTQHRRHDRRAGVLLLLIRTPHSQMLNGLQAHRVQARRSTFGRHCDCGFLG